MLFCEGSRNREEVAKVGSPVIQEQHPFNRGIGICYNLLAGLERYESCFLDRGLISNHWCDCRLDET